MTAPTEAQLRMGAGRRLFGGETTFIAGAASVESLPRPTLTEAALAGRSNVGKSSLINALIGRKSLARVSHSPGATRQINFYSVAGRLMLADLPGYGFARASKRQIGDWSNLIYLYLNGRAVLRRVVTLVDARRGVGDADRELFDFLDKTALSYQVVLTNADELHEKELAARLTETEAAVTKRPAAHPAIIVTSARTGAGIEELRAELATFAKN